jgi:hypothetical protein
VPLGAFEAVSDSGQYLRGIRGSPHFEGRWRASHSLVETLKYGKFDGLTIPRWFGCIDTGLLKDCVRRIVDKNVHPSGFEAALMLRISRILRGVSALHTAGEVEVAARRNST